MIFPREFVKVGSCLALVRLARGCGRSESLEGSPITSGYVRTHFGGEDWKASRLSYHLNVESIPRSPASLKSGIVLHSCDNNWCINPDHLSMGTASRNRKEMYARHPTIKRQRSLQGKARFSDPEYKEWMREKQRQAAKRQWTNPESRAKIMVGLQKRKTA